MAPLEIYMQLTPTTILIYSGKEKIYADHSEATNNMDEIGITLEAQ